MPFVLQDIKELRTTVSHILQGMAPWMATGCPSARIIPLFFPYHRLTETRPTINGYNQRLQRDLRTKNISHTQSNNSTRDDTKSSTSALPLPSGSQPVNLHNMSATHSNTASPTATVDGDLTPNTSEHTLQQYREECGSTARLQNQPVKIGDLASCTTHTPEVTYSKYAEPLNSNQSMRYPEPRDPGNYSEQMVARDIVSQADNTSNHHRGRPVCLVQSVSMVFNLTCCVLSFYSEATPPVIPLGLNLRHESQL